MQRVLFLYFVFLFIANMRCCDYLQSVKMRDEQTWAFFNEREGFESVWCSGIYKVSTGATKDAREMDEKHKEISVLTCGSRGDGVSGEHRYVQTEKCTVGKRMAC